MGDFEPMGGKTERALVEEEPVATADLEEDGENGEAAEVASSEVEMVETASEDRGPLTFMVKALKGTTESVPATTSISTKESNVETVAL